MFTYTRTETNHTFIWRQKPRSKRLWALAGALVFICVLSPVWARWLLPVTALIYIPVVVVLLFWLLALIDVGDLVLARAIAKASGKRIAQSGAWWSGTLRYEIDK